MENYRRKIYFAIILITLGIVMGSVQGMVFMAIGGLLFCVGMYDRWKPQ